MLSRVALDVPPWVLVVMAYEKRALLWFPVPADSQFTRTTAKHAMAVLVLLSFARHQHVVWGQLYHTVVITKVNGTGTPPTPPTVAAAAGVSTEVTNTTTTTTTTMTARAANQYEISNRAVCDVSSNGLGIFMTQYEPLLDLMLRVVAPCACLTAYTSLILRRIKQEKYYARRLLRKVGILPPAWLHTGLKEMKSTVRWTATLTFLICLNSLPYTFFYILQPLSFVSRYIYIYIYYYL